MNEKFEVISNERFFWFKYNFKKIAEFEFNRNNVLETSVSDNCLTISLRHGMGVNSDLFYNFKLKWHHSNDYSLNCEVEKNKITVRKPKRVSNWVGDIEYYNLLKYYLESNILTFYQQRTEANHEPLNLPIPNHRRLALDQLVARYADGVFIEQEAIERVRDLGIYTHLTDDEIMNVLREQQRVLLWQRSSIATFNPNAQMDNFHNPQAVGRSLRQRGNVSPNGIVSIIDGTQAIENVNVNTFQQWREAVGAFQSNGISSVSIDAWNAISDASSLNDSLDQKTQEKPAIKKPVVKIKVVNI